MRRMQGDGYLCNYARGVGGKKIAVDKKPGVFTEPLSVALETRNTPPYFLSRG